jgi:hypothetical protein
MDDLKFRQILELNLGIPLRVTPSSGESHLIIALAVDEEGFSYKLLDQGEDVSTIHWWPFDEVVSVATGDVGTDASNA